MSEKLLSLSLTKFNTFSHNTIAGYFRILCVSVGALVVLVGAAGSMSLLAGFALGPDAAFSAFAPVAALHETSVVSLATTTPLIPGNLSIPAIGVNAHVEQVGTNAVGDVGTPHTFGDVAWYMLGPKPGEPGNAIIDGHVNNALTTAGVFEHLSDLRMGDAIILSDSTGRTLVYTVTKVKEYTDANAPLPDIFSTTGPSQLILITCDGQWLGSAHSFNQRLVVYASLTHS